MKREWLQSWPVKDYESVGTNSRHNEERKPMTAIDDVPTVNNPDPVDAL